MTEIIDIVEL